MFAIFLLHTWFAYDILTLMHNDNVVLFLFADAVMAETQIVAVAGHGSKITSFSEWSFHRRSYSQGCIGQLFDSYKQRMILLVKTCHHIVSTSLFEIPLFSNLVHVNFPLIWTWVCPVRFAVSGQHFPCIPFISRGRYVPSLF